MSNVFQLLNKIRQTPGMYLGCPSASDLCMFSAGYEFARSELGQDLSATEEYFYANFQPWLQEKLGVQSVTSWAKLIVLSCHDEKAGFDKFFQLLDEFMEQSDRQAA